MGSLSASSGNINSQGTFATTFHASAFSGKVRVTATVSSISYSSDVTVKVQSLGQLVNGTGFQKVGSTTLHPNGWYGTTSMIQGLQGIAVDYKEFYYDSVPISQPSGDRLLYNDMSLVYGGKFDLNGNWCTSCNHSEHTVGSNIDLGSNPSPRHSTLVQMFVNNGSTSVVDETATKNHWHVRF